MTRFTQDEINFLQSMEEARLATCHDNIPHVKPVSFIFHNDAILIATDYTTRSYKNVKTNPKTSIVIDVYSHGGHKAVCVQGDTDILERGKEFEEAYQLFYEKFKWVRDDPWKEGEAPFLRIIPTNVVSWGINKNRI